MPLTRKLLLLASIVIALALLYPGVTQPVMTLQGNIEKADITALGIDLLAGEDPSGQARQMLSGMAAFMGLDQVEGQVQAYHSTRSIWGTARSLADSGNAFVATLIVLFSVVIPSVKLLLQALALAIDSPLLLAINGALSKWSMTDVFVMALLVAYMAGNASGKTGGLMIMDAKLEVGFYFFLGYCLFSIAAGNLVARQASPGLTR